MSEQGPPIWQWFNGSAKGIALIYVNGEHKASPREGEYGYFKAEPSDSLEIYEMKGYGLDTHPERMELPFASGTVDELAQRYRPPNG